MARRADGEAVDVAEEVARLVGAGKTSKLPTVNFSDPNRPKTCLEVDFPILPVNQVASIEGNAGKPIYQMSKWWARRRSSVFRAMLIAAATKAPDDPAHAAKLVWDSYYHNHQKGGAFKNLKVADIFMGGGTTVIEGSRLGMQMFGCDLNPVAWLVVKNEVETASIKREQVEALLTDIEAEVKPQIMPFYACDCPRGHRGKWIKVATEEVMKEGFDPLRLKPEERKAYRYEGPEIIYVFWAKHGPCTVSKCGHRTPLMSTPIIAIKDLTVKFWPHKCAKCRKGYEIEDGDARMAPGVPLALADGEKPFAVLNKEFEVKCPHCGHEETCALLGKGKSKKVSLTLLAHPSWLTGSPSKAKSGKMLGGSSDDPIDATIEWNKERASHLRLLEVRGELPPEVTCPKTRMVIKTGDEGGTKVRRISDDSSLKFKDSSFACASCGTAHDVMEATKKTKKNGPVAAYVIQGFCPQCASEGHPYNGRFFAPATDTRGLDTAIFEWANRKDSDLKGCWPTSEVPYGFMTAQNNGDIRIGHGYTHFWKMFNSRQLLVHALLLKNIVSVGTHSWETREAILGAFQQYLRNQNMFTIWNVGADKLEPMFSNSNYHPKSTMVENCVYPKFGRGNWRSCYEGLLETIDWSSKPWEVVSRTQIEALAKELADQVTAKSVKTTLGDPVTGVTASIQCASATELDKLGDATYDLVITDPPFAGNLHYSELADYFHVWLRLKLKDKYPDYFTAEYTPKNLEAVTNVARHPDDADEFYQRILTACWKSAHRILKPGGLLAFTFHHSADEPWVQVLESLFDAGLVLEATYPIRSDETKGEGAKPGTFGSQKIEYDIIHVCRKRTEEPKPVSWARMRREIMNDVSALSSLLKHHEREGALLADLQIIKRGKALEYYSRHYGKVFVDEERLLTVKAALLGINQVIDEDPNDRREAPPANAEPQTRQLLRLFYETSTLGKDQMSKALRGTGVAPDEFVAGGWCILEKKTYRLVPAIEIAQSWSRRPRRLFTSDYEQAMFLVGACFDGSGVNAKETLNNDNFRPHPALKNMLNWFIKHGAGEPLRRAAGRALAIYQGWERENADKAKKDWLFDMEEEV